MSTLLTVSCSWYNKPALYEQLAFASPGDAILLLQDGVLALQSPIALASFVAKCARANIAIYALQDDIELRGVDNCYPDIIGVNYDGFVELVIEYDKQLAW